MQNLDKLFTPSHVTEIIKCSKDPLYFIENYVKIYNPQTGIGNFSPTVDQRSLISNYDSHQFVVSNMVRQSGKSVASLSYILWYAMFNHDKTIVIAGAYFRMNQNLMLLFKTAYDNLPDWLKAGMKSMTYQNISFDNNNSITFTTINSNAYRGMGISLFYVDELSSMSQKDIEQFYFECIPFCKACNTKLLISSSPSQNRILLDILRNSSEEGIGYNGFKLFRSNNSIKSLLNQQLEYDV